MGGGDTEIRGQRSGPLELPSPNRNNHDTEAVAM